MRGIYQIRNKINGKKYIGSSQDIEARWVGHKRKLNNGGHYNTYLQRAWDKYGEENFVLDICEEVDGSRGALISHEQEYLDREFELGALYNVAQKAGGGNLGKEVNQKIGKIMSRILKGRRKSKEHKQNLSRACLGREMSDKTKAKISRALVGRIPWNKGKPRPKETIQMQRESMLEYYKTHDSPMKGKHHSDSTKEQMRQSAKGKKQEGKPYPAFYNMRTGQTVPPGTNLATLCQTRQLNYNGMLGLKLGKIKSTKDGWLLGRSFDTK